MKSCAVIMTLRRSKLSAMAPDASEKSMIGRAVEAWTRATIPAESVIEAIIQAAPTAWIRLPKFATRFAVQIALYVSCLKGERKDARPIDNLLSLMPGAGGC